MNILLLFLLYVGVAALKHEHHLWFIDDVGNFFRRTGNRIATITVNVKDKVVGKLGQVSNTVPQKIDSGVNQLGQKLSETKQRVSNKLGQIFTNDKTPPQTPTSHRLSTPPHNYKHNGKQRHPWNKLESGDQQQRKQ